jgi:hypothetical protein
MFEYTKDRPIDSMQLMHEINRLQRLSSDLMMLEEGVVPVNGEAPILDNWIWTSRNVACLAGEVTGHPLLPGKRRQIITSDVWVMAEDLSCARTLSRWYRLGRPYGSKQSA